MAETPEFGLGAALVATAIVGGLYLVGIVGIALFVVWVVF